MSNPTLNTFFIKTFGCKTNQYEGEAIRELLLKEGFIEAGEDRADTYIVNACSVTEKAEKEWTRYAHKIRSSYNNGFFVLTGCYPTPPDRELFNLTVGFGRRKELPELLKERVEGYKKSDLRHFEDLSIEDHKGHTRAFLKIQEGCDLCCTYCIVPTLRGSRIRSKPVSGVIEEFSNLLKHGFYEIVLTGTHLGAYGKDLSLNLVTLLEEILTIEQPFRLRLSSLEPLEAEEELIKIIERDSRLAKHLHLPLQSGSTKVLKAMGRPYNREEFLEKIEMIRSRISGIGISTDIMIGFPQEEEEDFFYTLDAIKRASFVKVHLFPFSPRPHTPASKLPRIKPDIIKERMERAQKMAHSSFLSFASTKIGQTLEVLAEKKRGDCLTGYSSEYIKVKFFAERNQKALYPVIIQNIEGDYLLSFTSTNPDCLL